MRHETIEHTTSRRSARVIRSGLCLLLGCLVLACLVPLAGAAIKQRTFDTPEKAVEAFIAASERYDVEALKKILGDDGVDLVISEDAVQSKNQAVEFAKMAREKSVIEIVPLDPNVAILSVGPDDWPLPIPIVREGGKWRFDTAAGREELLYRRIGQNELDAIEICLGYVEAQEEYALTKHDGSRINQYAQRVLSTPGKRDGLAWQDPDGTWQGPVGEAIARIIAEGYPEKPTPFHGYTFKILKGQGPAAPLGEMDFMVNGAMIGGFALVAAPADYEVSGVMTFIVSHDGIVYQKDLGPKTAEAFKTMDRYNPDETWSPVFGQ